MSIFIAFVVGLLFQPVIWPQVKRVWRVIDRFMSGKDQ